MARKRAGSGKATVFDVAREAGVSAITVSRVIRTPAKVAAATRARVEDVVARMGYVPDPAAKALASDRSDTIGVIVPSLTNSVFSDTLRGIYDVADGARYQVQIANTRYAPRAEERLIRVFLSQRAAGLIVTGIDQSEAAARALSRAPCPVVQITETGPAPFDMMVGFGHGAAAAAGARHLLERGYRRIGFLGARRDPRSQRRLLGFREALAEAGLYDPDLVLFSEDRSSVPLGAAQLGELLARADDADAVLCNNDELALGVLFECQRRGIGIPGDFGICGFNDIAAMGCAHPAITSIRTPRREVGRQAMEMLLARLAGEAVDRPHRDLGFELIARASTAR